jgi:4'-phosphopantetheinyl transferase
VQVWQVDLRQPAEWVDAAAAHLLHADERRLASRGTPEVRRRRIVSRAALRIALARRLGTAPGALTFSRGPHGKPALAEDAGLHFNVSHSAECCVIAVTEAGSVGIDIEHVLPVVRLDAIATKHFGASDAKAILRLAGRPRLKAFHECWTRREALLKAAGTGLAGTLDEGGPRGWTLASVRPEPDVVGTIAIAGAHEFPDQWAQTTRLSLDAVCA